MTTSRPPADPTDADIEQGMRRSLQLEDAPEHVIQRAIATWQPMRQAVAAAGLVERLLAVLTFDSGAAATLSFGMRSAGGTTRQMLFSADGHDIDLRISPAGDAQAGHWLLSGQVLGPDARGIVSLADALGQVVSETALDELGEFRLPAVAPGRYTVTLRLGAREIELPATLVPQAT